MKDVNNLITETEIISLREGIKNRYRHYHLLDRDRFPDFEYNTNRANYEPLRASFDEEFFVVRGIDRASPIIHTPSTNTLALLFTDDGYLPGRKILNTCHLYARGKENADPATVGIIPGQSENRNVTKIRRGLFFAGILIIAAGLAIFMYRIQSNSPPRASGLVITQPGHRQIVPRIIYVEGKVTNADVVWIVVRPMRKGDKCYVQSLAIVEKDGTWKGAAYIGTPGKASADIKFQIRAFVNPGGAYKAIEKEGKYMFDSWPEETELASEAVVVVRGSDG